MQGKTRSAGIKITLALLVLYAGLPLYGSGGGNTWEFLNLSPSARVAGLGGKNISIRDGDLNMVFYNPALLDSTMNNHLALNYVNYFAGISHGYASWSFLQGRWGLLAAGIHYIDYGDFTAADPSGIIHGSFSAREGSVNLAWAVPVSDLFTAGVTFKMINSSFEQYRSSGIAVDAGLNYFNTESLISASLVIKNLGLQLSAWYPGGEREPLPFEVQLGMTKQLAHAPFRFSLLYQQLQNTGLDKNRRDGNPPGGLVQHLENIGNEAFRHLVAGIEFIPVQGLYINAGYNSLRRYELKINERASTAGLSWGFGIRLTRFSISFGQARYHLAGSSNHFSVTANLSALFGS